MKSRPVSPVLVGLLMVLCSLISFIAMGASGLYRDFEFNGNVGQSIATVERLETSSHGRGGTEYDAIVSFVAGKESMFEDNIRVAPGTYYRLHAGDKVPIKYLSNQPVQARIVGKDEDDWHWQHDETGLGVGLFLASIGLIIAWYGRRRQEGQPPA